MALIYNNWMIYLPTYAERDEGLLKIPVMCSTTRWVGGSYRDIVPQLDLPKIQGIL